MGKLLGMLHELVPKASIIAVLLDPNGADFERQSRDLEEAARAIGRQILIVNAAKEREFHAAFAKVVQAGAGGLLIIPNVFFFSHSQRKAEDAKQRAARASESFYKSAYEKAADGPLHGSGGMATPTGSAHVVPVPPSRYRYRSPWRATAPSHAASNSLSISRKWQRFRVRG
jgi:hypothetical protein